MQLLKASLRLCILISVFCGGGWAQESKDGELRQALAKVDEVSRGFRSFSAKMTQKKYTAILEEFDTPESGRFYYALDKSASVSLRHEVQIPGKRILIIKGDKALHYEPRVNQAKIYSLGKNKNLVEYLGTGLGQSSEKLNANFNISYQGSGVLNGVPCWVLAFKPKDTKVAASVRSITIWFQKAIGTPVQYKIEEPSGDYLLETFSETKLNGKMSEDLFDQKLPKGVEILKF